jgi:putative hydrolase of the HAD superfamily
VRQLGMRTVWMQRYLKNNPHGPQLGGSPHRRPAWVCAKIRQLRSLHAWGA